MAAPRYLYQRRGGPIVRWDHESGRPPRQTKAGDAQSMGSLGGNVFDTPRVLPRGGAPEYLHPGMGCSDKPCGGSCGGGCGGGMGGLADMGPTPKFLILAAVAYLLLRKKKR